MIGKVIKFWFVNQTINGLVLDKYRGAESDEKFCRDFYLVKRLDNPGEMDTKIISVRCSDIIDVLPPYSFSLRGKHPRQQPPQ